MSEPSLIETGGLILNILRWIGRTLGLYGPNIQFLDLNSEEYSGDPRSHTRHWLHIDIANVRKRIAFLTEPVDQAAAEIQLRHEGSADWKPYGAAVLAADTLAAPKLAVSIPLSRAATARIPFLLDAPEPFTYEGESMRPGRYVTDSRFVLHGLRDQPDPGKYRLRLEVRVADQTWHYEYPVPIHVLPLPQSRVRRLRESVIKLKDHPAHFCELTFVDDQPENSEFSNLNQLTASVRFYDAADPTRLVLDVPDGAWSDLDGKLILVPPPRPNEPFRLTAAVGYENDDNLYGFNPQSLKFDRFRQPSLALRFSGGRSYRMIVTLRASRQPAATFEYLIRAGASGAPIIVPLDPSPTSESTGASATPSCCSDG
ncbi:MAG: hypothetical protein IT580_24970 [Verrucomicrobiales bacterium]|nr:hypothetical protein [Verrucomicrobiales bacterium]